VLTPRDTHDAEIATPTGVAALLDWVAARSPGPRTKIAVEGSRSYGIGLARAAAAGHVVLEIERPARSQRRQRGKSDPIEALRVAGRQPTANRTQLRDLVAQMRRPSSSWLASARCAQPRPSSASPIRPEPRRRRRTGKGVTASAAQNVERPEPPPRELLHRHQAVT